MAPTRFSITQVFDLPTRGGIIAVGKILQGEIKGGQTLQEESTGRPVPILGVEFPTPKAQQENLTAVVVDRQAKELITVGAVLISRD